MAAPVLFILSIICIYLFGICLGAENYRMSYHLFAVYISLIGKHWLEIFSQIERINGDMRSTCLLTENKSYYRIIGVLHNRQSIHLRKTII